MKSNSFGEQQAQYIIQIKHALWGIDSSQLQTVVREWEENISIEKAAMPDVVNPPFAISKIKTEIDEMKIQQLKLIIQLCEGEKLLKRAKATMEQLKQEQQKYTEIFNKDTDNNG